MGVQACPVYIMRENIYRSDVQVTSSYFWALPSFEMFAGPLFQIKLHLASTALLSGFQSSLWVFKSTE